MIVTLDIRKTSSQAYLAQLLAGGAEMGNATLYDSLSDAIQAEAWCLPEDGTRVVEVRYAGLSGGSWHADELALQAGPLSERLSELAAALG
jgi:hypothetical protein